MDEINVYYQIVPIGDGYNYVCQNKETGELYLRYKGSDKIAETLLFHSVAKAQKWLEDNNYVGKYEPEEYATIYVMEEYYGVGE